MSFCTKSAVSLSSQGKESNPSQLIAICKGLTVAVTRVNKPEVNLTRQDLVELFNVSSLETFSSEISNYCALCFLTTGCTDAG
jgi:hypothetical protein